MNLQFLVSVFLCITFLSGKPFAQSKYEKSLEPTLVFSLKAGVHSGDKDKTDYYYPVAYTNDLPFGFVIDGSFEKSTGKAWYLGLDFNYHFGSDEAFDYFANEDISRDSKLFSITLYTKKRIFLGEIIPYIAAGLGNTNVHVNYSGYSEEKSNLIHIMFKLGVDYPVTNNLFLSFEGVYLGMTEISFHGDGRNNREFQIITGLTYALPKL